MKKLELTLFICVCLVSFSVFAENKLEETELDPDVENALSGFEEKSQDSLDAVLDGFDDSTDTDKSSADDELENVLDGFDDPDEAISEKPSAEAQTSSFWTLSGYGKASTSYNFAHNAPEPGETDYRSFSRLRAELELKLDLALLHNWKARVGANFKHDFIYALNGRDNYTDEVLDSYETEIELRELFLQGTIASSLDLAIGRQIVPWGTSAIVRVVDILNPLDLRQFGMLDIEDLRLPVAMTRLNYYLGSWDLTGIAIHEMRFNTEEPYGSDYYPAEIPPPPEDVPSSSLENTEFAVAAIGRFAGWDLSFHAANYFDDYTHLALSTAGQPERKYSRLSMTGSTIVWIKGNWLLKAEGAYVYGYEFFHLPDEKKSGLDVLAGIEYFGFNETNIILEVVNRHIFDYDERLSQSPDNVDENEFRSVLQISRDFRHDTLHLGLLVWLEGETGQKGSFQRISLGYDWTDALNLTLGSVFYQAGSSEFFTTAKDNDRLFFDIKYSF